MAKRTIKNCGRKKAIWGAIIPAAVSALSTIYSASQNAKQQRDALARQNRLQAEQNERDMLNRTAQSLNNYLGTVQEIPEEQFVYKRGGRRKLKNAAIITDGGVAIPIDYNTSLLRGSTHAQTNEQGKTGIGINTGNGEIEAENGEVVENKGDQLRIFSAQPLLNGISPAEAVLNGADKDKVFRTQERLKRRYHLRNGMSTPVEERPQAAWGATWGTADYVGLGTNILGSLLANTYASRAYNRLADDISSTLPEYVDASFVAGPTTYYNAGQRGNIERERLINRRSVARNTASSNTALDRMQAIDTAAMGKLNEAWDTKANKEAELRMENAKMENEMRIANARNRNDYYRTLAEIQNRDLTARNAAREAAINSNVGMIQGIGSSIGGFLQQGINNYQNDQAMRLELAKSQYGTAEKAAAMGFRFDNGLINDLVSDYRAQLSSLEGDTSESANKTRSTLEGNIAFWNNYNRELASRSNSVNNWWRRLFGNRNRRSITDYSSQPSTINDTKTIGVRMPSIASITPNVSGNDFIKIIGPTIPYNWKRPSARYNIDYTTPWRSHVFE